MSILLHTIALEPARWTPSRVARPLTELLPAIAQAGFTELEIFEPHLTHAPDPDALQSLLQKLALTPVMLSSYLNVNPAVLSDDEFVRQSELLLEWITRFGFTRLRLFPGSGVSTTDRAAIAIVIARLEKIAEQIPGVAVLLETHDGSLADDPAVLVSVMQALQGANFGLLYQPTFFNAARALEQMRLERPFVQHIHLQNRLPDFSFASLQEGLFSWPEILAELGKMVPMTLEFVPAGICAVEAFDLAQTLQQVRAEMTYAGTLLR